MEELTLAEVQAKAMAEKAVAEGDDRRKADREELAVAKRQVTALTAAKNAVDTRAMDLEASSRRQQVTTKLLSPWCTVPVYYPLALSSSRIAALRRCEVTIISLVLALYITPSPCSPPSKQRHCGDTFSGRN